MNRIEWRLHALDPTLANAWERAFADVKSVSVVRGSILESSADAIVSPANSFGYMDGGLDLRYSEHFGWDLEDSVRARILADYDGELPVGQAIIVPMTREDFGWLVSAPTMRVPMNVARTANAFLAFRGVLRAVRQHNAESTRRIESVACPGLGTGEGRMPADRCAKQMRHAYDVVVDGRTLTKGGLAGAVRNHLWLIDEPM